MRAKPVNIAMVVSSSQMHANGAKIQQFSAALSGDLNRRATARSGSNGPIYSVDVLSAGADAPAVRNQLKPYDGAILIGVVPVPLVIDGIDGFAKPLMDPFRLPSCGEYRFSANSNRIDSVPQEIDNDPSCRHGMPVAVLRGQSQLSDLADVEKKLDQFIAYHKASDQNNLNWSPDFQYTWALWGGSAPYLPADTLADIWPAMTLNGGLQHYPSPAFVTDGTAAFRKDTFKRCLASEGEMCVVGGHGNSSSILFEGPDALGKYYSDDHVSMASSEIQSNGASAKYVEMLACSSQDFLRSGSFATTLLMSGKTMLTMGSSTTSWGSSNFVFEQAQEVYPYLALGSTFAEAVRGSLRGNAISMQGDPYISFRPVPARAPKLVINGKHYNDGNFIFPMVFADSIAGSSSQAVLHLSNAGMADLHIQLAWASRAWSIDGKPTPEGGFNGGFSLVDPYPISGSNHGSGIGNKIFTIKPNQTMKVTYKMAPLVYSPPGAPVTGILGSTLQLFSDDPASYKITLDATMRIH
ncbi:hypothetical protein [Massilia agrisoli]|uniref:hypothetical protein n=1 Tax=Massilia sp. GCM10020059 TaxID=3317334 RepID=UPI0036D4100C